jgi:Tol biopolymer transport system component
MSEIRTAFEELVKQFDPTPEILRRTIGRAHRRRRGRRLAAAATALVVALLGVGGMIAALRDVGGSGEVGTPNQRVNGQIVFVRLKPGVFTGDLFSMNQNGTGLRRITRTGNVSVQLALSPDGTRVAFAGTSGDPLRDAWNIYVVGADGSNLRQLTHAAGHGDIIPPRSPRWAINEWPSWTPDGRIRYFHDTAHRGVPGPGQGLWEMNVDGSHARRLVPDWIPTEPAWSPDGTRLAWASSKGLAVGEPGESHAVVVPGHDIFTPAWSPDGGRIVFVRGPTLAVVAPDGTGLRTLFRCGDRCSMVDFPTWSPDGHRIAFQLHRQIAVVNEDGTGLRLLRASSGACCPLWRPLVGSTTPSAGTGRHSPSGPG